MKVVKLEDCINEIKSLDNNGIITRSVNHICEDMRAEVKEFDAIPVPKNATNGDMIKAMFPSDKNELDISKLHLMYDGLDFIKEFRKDWWNAPYTGGEDN